ncbi:MAG: hypothetical protein M1830_005208 [Pleopsidium flavum]|nr:MAG: hypothetical protein M1830_005208 [Pleopsidium flavum]
MKYSYAALFMGLASVASANTNSSMASDMPSYTTSTVYSTQEVTITSCAPTVTSCPASSTMVVTSVVAVSTTVCPVTANSAAAAAAAPSSSAESMMAAASSSMAPNAEAASATTTVFASPCPSSASSSANDMVTRSAASSATVTAPKFTSIPVNGTMTGATGTSSMMPVFTGAASKVAGSVGGVVVALAAAFAL